MERCFNLIENIRINIDSIKREKYNYFITLQAALGLMPIYKVTPKIEELRKYIESLCEPTSLSVVNQSIKTIEEKLRNEGGQNVVSSRDVAVRFGKRYDNVIRAIEENIKINLKLRASNYYIENTYTDSMNRPKKEYLMTRDGFTSIVMGFTGKEVLQFKLAYIEAFNKMEEALKQRVHSMEVD